MFGSLRPYVAFYNSGWDSLQNCKNKGLKGVLGPCFAREIKKLDSNFVSKLESRGGEPGGIRTHDLLIRSQFSQAAGSLDLKGFADLKISKKPF